MKEINVGLFWANPYSGNLGVSALSYSSLYLLERVAKRRNLKFNYTILNGTGPKHDTLEIGNSKVTITNYPWDYTGSFKSLVKLGLWNWYQILKLFKFDVIFDIGEGDSFSDIYGIKRFRKINGSKKILHLLGKKIILLPQTMGPFNSTEAKRGGTASIKKAQLVLARDKQSFNYVAELVPARQVFELIDVAFFMPYKPTNLSGSKIKIGINVSGLLWNGGYTEDNQFDLKSNYKDLTIKIISYFLENTEHEIYLVAHVTTKVYEKLENDLKVCHEINKLYPTTILAPAFTTPIEAKSFISGLDFFTGARMHACIAAFSTGVPVFPLAYSRKFNGLFGDTLNYEYYGDLVALGIDDVLSDLRSAFENRNELKEAIKAAEGMLANKESELLNLLSDGIPEPK